MNNLGRKNLNVLPILDVLEGKLSVSQKITNFLSSASAFLDRTDKQLQRIHNKDSSEYTAWDKLRKDLHASSFSYKFVYKLRNFSQHRDLPFNSYAVIGKRELESNHMIFRADIVMMRDKLLEDGKDFWDSSTKKELINQPPEFDLLPFITKYLQHMRQLCLKAIWIQNIKLVRLNNYLDTITSKNPVDTIPVIYTGESKSEDFPPSKVDFIPIEEFKYLLREFDRLITICEAE